MSYNRINWKNYPLVDTALNATNLNNMDSTIYEHDQTLTNWTISKADKSDILHLIKDVTYNDSNGRITFTFFNDTTTIIETELEKIAVNFDYDDDPTSSHYQQLVITLSDGSIKYIDLSALITQYEFQNSSTINFTVGSDGKVSADIINGSITDAKLQPNYLADITQQATNATTAATSAESSKSDAEAWAVGKRNGVDVPSTDETYENNSKYWAEEAKSYVGAMGITDTEWAQLQTLWAI